MSRGGERGGVEEGRTGKIFEEWISPDEAALSVCGGGCAGAQSMADSGWDHPSTCLGVQNNAVQQCSSAAYHGP